MNTVIPQEMLQRFFGTEYNSLEILRVAQYGISGSKVVLVRNGGPKLYALKYGLAQTPLSRQVENRNILAKLMPTRVLEVYDYCEYPGGEALLMEGIGGPNLHEAVMLAHLTEAGALEITKSLLTEFKAIWTATREDFREVSVLARDPKTRAAKAIKCSRDVLLSHGVGTRDRLIVNGTEVGSLASLEEKFACYEYPCFSVLCHQDLNADNFLLNEELSKWYVADWEWVGRHDWKVSMSQAYGWWSAMALGLKSKASLRCLNHNTFMLTYEVDLPDICKKLQEQCLVMSNLAATELREKGNWQQMFWLLVAYFLLAQLRFSKVRGRENFVLPLLGEGLRILASV